MNGFKPGLFASVVIAMLCAPCGFAAPAPVLQRAYDAGATGANLAETTLTPANVTGSGFGLVFTLPVDDNVMAQPLYVPNVAIAGHGTHNVLYVATMSDSLYAFDADTGGAPLWHINLATLVGATPVPIANFTFSGNRNIIGNLGVLSTPVIDPSTNVLYLVACTLEGGTLAYRLHAVSILDGSEPHGPGVLLAGSYKSSTFDARYATQRMSLVLSANNVVFGFGAVELEYSGGYTGWVMAYDKTTLAQTGIFATVPTGNRGGGVWQSGRPPVVDAGGDVYAFSGNGYGGGYDGVNSFSETALKLNPGAGLNLVDWFTPGNWSTLDNNDQDLTSSGPMLIPGTSLLAGGGKNGVLYLLNTSTLGKFNANDSQVVQRLQIAASEIRGGPVYWNRPTANGGPLLYDWGTNDVLKAFAFNGSSLQSTPSSQGSAAAIAPGGILTLSANGGVAGTGVLWATVATSGNAIDNPPVPGALYAFDAGNVSAPIWSSATNAARDSFGNFAKFVPPMVANGRIYVSTWSNQVAVYGLIPKAAPFSLKPAVSPFTLQQNAGGSDAVTVVDGAGFSGQVALSVSGAPAGVSAVFVGNSLIVFPPLATPTGTYPLTLTGTSGATTVTTVLNLVITPGATFSLTPAAPSVTVTTGSSGTEAIGIAPVAGFASPVSFTAAGLPAGATAAFSPASSSSGTTLTLATTAATPTGSYPIKITGSAGGTNSSAPFAETTTVTLVVSAPTSGAPFSLKPAASPLTLQQNAGGTDTVSVVDGAGFSGQVALSVSGAPAGVSAVFVGNLLVVFPSLATPTGTYPLTLTGTSGTTRVTTVLNLVITPGATFSLTPASPSLTVTRGSNATDAIGIAPVAGFAGAVSFTAAGLPAGATAAFSPASSPSGTTLTLAATAATPTGSYPIKITGSAGATNSSAAFAETATVTLVVD